MSQSYATQVATRICSKDTVKATGLNIWVSGEHSHNEPEVEYDKQLFIKLKQHRWQAFKRYRSSRSRCQFILHMNKETNFCREGEVYTSSSIQSFTRSSEEHSDWQTLRCRANDIRHCGSYVASRFFARSNSQCSDCDIQLRIWLTQIERQNNSAQMWNAVAQRSSSASIKRESR